MIRAINYRAVLIAVLLSTPVYAQLILTPQEIDVNDVMQSKKVLITFNGEAVLPAEISGIVSGVSKTGDAVPESAPGDTHFSDYSFMFDFAADDDGFITITPKKGLVEIGSYDLLIRSVHGTVRGLIDANLRDSIPPREHHPVNLSEFSYEIKLPDYVYGQRISVDLNPDSKNIYSWYIDGKIHSSGLGQTSFSGWPEIGAHEISYVARDPDGRIVSQWSDKTNVTEEDVIPTTVRKGYKVPFSVPGGFSQVTWSLDGETVSDRRLDRLDQDTQLITFRSKGKHILTCFARGSETGDFRLIKWSVKVK